jgi:hypothetical protein
MSQLHWLLNKIKANLHWLFIGVAIVFAWKWVDHAFSTNQDIIKLLLEGVISGVITSLFILVFVTLWRSNISEWLQDITYRDAKIEGVWQGFLVPYIGIKEIDRMRLQAAWAAFMTEKMHQASSDESDDAIDVDSSPVISSDEPAAASAELILPSEQTHEANDSDQPGNKTMLKRIRVGVRAQPIKIRAELTRVGNRIQGQLVEIGGASEVHTYVLNGTFKNLILCGSYENENPQNIDRGSFSLMLKENGLKLEGFFASYTESGESIHPFKCELKRNVGAPSLTMNSNIKIQKTGAVGNPSAKDSARF